VISSRQATIGVLLDRFLIPHRRNSYPLPNDPEPRALIPGVAGLAAPIVLEARFTLAR
jgi:hypothetical protein